MPRHYIRQLFGFNPFKTSYFSLYRPVTGWKANCILVLGIICAIAAGVPLPIIGVIFSRIIDSFPPTEDALNKSIGQLLGVAVAYFLVTWSWAVCWGVTGEVVARGLREALVEKILGMNMTFFDVEAPDMTAVLTRDTQLIQLGTSEKCGLFIQSISYFVAAFCVGFYLEAQLTGILMAAIVPSMIIVVISGTTAVSKFSKRAADLTDKAADVAAGAISAVQIVQAFDALPLISQDYSRILHESARSGFKKGLSGAIMLGSVYFTTYSANALAFWKGARLQTGAGSIYAVVFLILDSSFVVGQFGPFIQTFAQAAAAGGTIIELLDRTDVVANPYDTDGHNCVAEDLSKDITFDEVSFCYPARPTTRVLNKVSLCFKSGTLTGVVGMSGSGKSTIASLLLRLYEPSSGTIRIGDVALTDMNLGSLRREIALVDQDPVLFSGTILENIAHGISDTLSLTSEEVLSRCVKAAEDANASFIATLPHGIQTRVGISGGTSLSGGQKQRICLARALVRRPSVLILDEPTAALDTLSEALILRSLEEAATTGCTVIMIAHRLATITNAHNIIVMGHGAVLSQGTHSALMTVDGPYRALVNAQAISKQDHMSLSTPSTDSDDSVPKAKASYEKGEIEDAQAAERDESERSEDLGVLKLLARCLSLSKPKSLLIAMGIAASAVSGGIIIGEAIIFGRLVSLINTQETNQSFRSEIDFHCLMFFVVSLIALAAYSASGTAFGAVSEALQLRVREISLKTILCQDQAWFALPGHSSDELMASISTDVGHLSGMSGVIIGTICSVLVSVTGGIVLAHIVAWKIAIVLLSAVPVVVMAGFLRLRVLTKFEERHESAYNGAAALASEACRLIRTVAAFGREKHILERYRQAIEEPYRQSFKFNVLGNLALATSFALTYFVYALAYYWGSRQVRDGNYSQQDFFIVLPALLFSAQSSGQLFSLAPEVTRARTAAHNVFRLHDEKPRIMDLPGPTLKGVSHDYSSDKVEKIALETVTDSRRGRVSLQGVGLTYPTRPKDPVLHDITLDIEPGQFIGIVGGSGAGKSSIIALLERFYDPSSGTVCVDQEDIRESPVSQYRQKLSLVSQEPDLFPGSIAFNIRVGAKADQEITQDNIEEVCERCGLHDFIMSLPEGYSTEAGLNGSKLSGGQKQRIAVARALIRDPDILLLDEATAALDSHSEKEIQKATTAAAENRTTIVVAHRLSSIQQADRIYVLDKGRIVEQGTHVELLRLGGIYAGMVQAQRL